MSRNRTLCLLFFFFSSLNGTLPYLYTDLIAKSTGEIEEEIKRFDAAADEKLALISKAENAINQWNDLCTLFLTESTKLYQTSLLSQEVEVRKYAAIKLVATVNNFQGKLDKNNAILQPLIAKIPMVAQKKGLAKPLKKPSYSLSLLNANLICFPDILTYYFGGIRPWKKRIEDVAKLLIASNADLLCLQEIWDPAAARALIHLLEKEYAYFFYDIGSQYATLDAKKMGYSSGLFVASKLPVKSSSFIPFQEGAISIKRGVFKIDCPLRSKKISIFTTHLSNNQEALKELVICTDLVQKASLSGHVILNGDLNIEAFSSDYEKSELSTIYKSPYLLKIKQINSSNQTATEYFERLVFTPPNKRGSISATSEILDYCLTLKSSALKGKTKLIPFYDLQKPEFALSDHQGLYTEWSFY